MKKLKEEEMEQYWWYLYNCRNRYGIIRNHIDRQIYQALRRIGLTEAESMCYNAKS